VVPRPAVATAFPGNLLRMKMFVPHSDLTESETSGRSSRSDACSYWRTTLVKKEAKIHLLGKPAKYLRTSPI
jgi:hypothetical protein